MCLRAWMKNRKLSLCKSMLGLVKKKKLFLWLESRNKCRKSKLYKLNRTK